MERGSFLTKYASEIESDPVGDYPRAKACLKELGFDPEEVSNEDYSSLRYIQDFFKVIGKIVCLLL